MAQQQNCGPLAKRETCAFVRGLLDRFVTHLACCWLGSGADVDGTMDGVLVVVDGAVV